MEPFLVVFEMLGPVVTRGALRRAGEAGEAAERARTKAVVAANPTCRRPCSMRMPVSRKAEPTKRSIAAARSSTPLLQRQRAVGRPQPVEAPSLGGRVLHRTCAACSAGHDDERPLARQAAPSQASAPRQAPSVVGEVLRSGGGRSLDARTRAYFEPRFGHDFGRVRVYDGALADASARSVSALAYTVGNDVVFRSGAFSPGTASGRRVLAHELVHVVQQRSSAGRGGAASGTLTVVPAADPSEREADRIADEVLGSGTTAVSTGALGGGRPLALARQLDGETEPDQEERLGVAAALPELRAEAEAGARAPAAADGMGGEVVHSTARTPEEDPRLRGSRAVPSATVVCLRKWQPCRAPYHPGTWAARMTYHCPRLVLPFGIILPGTTRPAYVTIPDEFIGKHSRTGRDMYRCRPRSSVNTRSIIADAAATGLTRSMLFPSQAACHAGFRVNLRLALEAMFRPSGGGRPAGIRVNHSPPGGSGIPFPC